MLGFGAIGGAPIGAGGSGYLVIRKEIEQPQDIRSDGSVDETMPVTTADAAPDDHDPSPTRAALQQQRGVVVAQFCACRQTKKAGYPLSKNTGRMLAGYIADAANDTALTSRQPLITTSKSLYELAIAGRGVRRRFRSPSSGV
jgi:hypothetical protein